MNLAGSTLYLSRLSINYHSGLTGLQAHGTSETPVQPELRYGCDHATADKICNFNRCPPFLTTRLQPPVA